MKLKIELFNSPILRKKAVEVKEVDSEIRRLVEDMARTMLAEKGAGLAAPQVGVAKKIVVIQPDPDDPGILALVNPKIIRKSRATDVKEEGCLSFPDIFIDIRRPVEVEVEAINIKGKKVRLKADGILARIIQHEVDHLDGILFFNRLKFSEKLKFKLKYPKIKLWL